MENAPCLGLEILGRCHSGNQLIFFSLGEAISGLGITLILPQFFKPIYVFRLRAQQMNLTIVYLSVFLGTAMAVVASFVNSVQVKNIPVISYPYPWEVLATACFVFAYAIVARVFLFSALTSRNQCKKFAQAAADLLAHGKSEDRIDFSKDLVRNIENLVRLSGQHTNLRHETAFYLFVHRYSIEQSGNANSLLRILSEPDFCSILVTNCPWDTVRLLRKVSNSKLYSQSAEQFIQELGRQAIISPNSMMSREMGRKGFGVAPALTEVLFRDPFISTEFRPAFGLEHSDYEHFDQSQIEKAQHAVTCLVEICAEKRALLSTRIFHELPRYYEALARTVRQRQRADSGSFLGAYHLASGLVTQIETVVDQLNQLDAGHFKSLYVDPAAKRSYDFLDNFSESIFQVFLSVANDFEGGADKSWTLVLDLLNAVFPRYGDLQHGMNPLQQRLGQKILGKVSENMDGLYPTIVRVLVLFCWEDSNTLAGSSAWSILLRDFRFNLRRFSKIRKIDRSRYLPKSVTYDEKGKSFTRTFSLGTSRSRSIKLASFPRTNTRLHPDIVGTEPSNPQS